jgi:hypothetical protein
MSKLKLEVTYDRIVAFSGGMSGLTTLILENGAVMCENGATARALADAFDGFIDGFYHVNSKVIAGKGIVYSTDEMGILDGFSKPREFARRHHVKLPPVGSTFEVEIETDDDDDQEVLQ